jgi:capsular polysaccharide biosynthesis protein
MELRRLWVLVWHRKILVALCVIAALAAGYEVTPKATLYRATAELFLSVPPNSQVYNNFYNSDLQLGQEEIAYTYALIIPTIETAQLALSIAPTPRSPAQVASETRAVAIPSTTLIALSVTDSDPAIAQRLANAMAQAFSQRMGQLTPVATTNGGYKSPVAVTEKAGLPTAPLSTGLTRTLILSGAFGLVVAIGLVFLLDYVDLSARNPEEVERRIGLPVIGVVPYFPEVADRNWVPSGLRRSPQRSLADLDG